MLLNWKCANFCDLNGPQNDCAVSGRSHCQESCFSAHVQTCRAGRDNVNFRLSSLGLPDGPSDSNEQRARLVYTSKWGSSSGSTCRNQPRKKLLLQGWTEKQSPDLRKRQMLRLAKLKTSCKFQNSKKGIKEIPKPRAQS